MDDAQTLRSMVRDDAYRVVRVLKDGPTGKTELVTLDDEGPLVRKYIPAGIANASAWAAAMELDEPLLPRIESLYAMPDKLVVVYNYVPGRALDTVVAEEGRLGTEQSVQIVCDVCRAVGALHGCGVVHRDITPSNVVLATDGAHLVDLGIARRPTTGQGRDTTVLGTWGYAAPEQYGFAQTDARSDVYALGKLLGFLLTGTAPDNEAFDVLLQDENVVEPALAAVVARATAFEPSARYQSASELAQALVSAGEGDAVPGAYVALPASQAAPRVHEGTSARPTQAHDAPKGAASYLYNRALVRQALREFTQVGPLLKTLVICVWLPMFLLALLVVITTVSALTTGEPNWSLPEYFMSVLVVGGLCLMAIEVLLAVTQRGPYASGEKVLKSLLIRLLKIALVVFLLMYFGGALIGLALERAGM